MQITFKNRMIPNGIQINYFGCSEEVKIYLRNDLKNFKNGIHNKIKNMFKDQIYIEDVQ